MAAKGHVEAVRPECRMIVIRPDHGMFEVINALADYHGATFDATVLALLHRALGSRERRARRFK